MKVLTGAVTLSQFNDLLGFSILSDLDRVLHAQVRLSLERLDLSLQLVELLLDFQLLTFLFLLFSFDGLLRNWLLSTLRWLALGTALSSLSLGFFLLFAFAFLFLGADLGSLFFLLAFAGSLLFLTALLLLKLLLLFLRELAMDSGLITRLASRFLLLRLFI